MYSLDINFLKYHPDYNKPTRPDKPPTKPFNIADLIPVYIGVGVGLVFPALVYGGLLFVQMKTNEVNQEIAKLEEEGKSLDSKIVKIKDLEAETKGIETQTNALVKVFDQIRPWSAMLEDLRDRIPPRVQIETIKQTPGTPATATTTASAGTLEFSGFARAYADVNDFVLSLSQSKFLNAEDSKIKTAELVDAPAITGFMILSDNNSGSGNVTIKPPQIVKYTIKTNLSTIPASELIQELEKKGTSGLVARLRNIKDTGVETK